MNDWTSPVDIRPDHLEMVQDILRERLPAGFKVWVFGSRANWTTKDSSDLDLAVEGTGRLDYRVMADLEIAFEESDLPYTVDVVDLHVVNDAFKKIVESQRVPLPMAGSSGNEGREVALSDIGTIDRGRSRHRPRNAPELYGGPYPFIQTGDIKSSGGRIVSHTQTYSELGLSQSRLWPAGTMAITIAANIAETAILTYPACFPDSVVGFIGDQSKCDTRFVEYNFRQLRNKIQHENVGTGSAQDNINLQTLGDLRFPLPPLAEQRAIAHILGTLDDKIELNRRMNQTLEAMARAIFQDWFVDFGPVRAKMEGQDPYLPSELWDLFPDELVDSELGEIPEGWEVGNLGDVARSPTRSVSPAGVEEETPYIGLEHMPRRSIALSEWESADKVTSNKLAFQKGEFLFGKLRPYFHKIGTAPVDGICSTDMVVVRPIENSWSSFVLLCVSTDEFVGYTDQTSTGTRMPRTNWKTMSRYELCLPPEAIAQVFQGITEHLLDRILANIHQARSAASQRNALVPKLISGEVQLV